MSSVVKWYGYIVFLIILCQGAYHTSAETYQPSFVFVGDSNTASVQWKNGSFVVKLPELGNPWDQLNITNSGHDGWGAFSYFQQPEVIMQNILNYNPDFILVALGGNDFLHFQNAVQFQASYHYLISGLENISASCDITQVYLANIYWGSLSLPDYEVQRYEDFQQIINNTAAEYNLPLLDFFSVTENHTEYYLKDNIHLNEQGHWAIAEAINQQIGSDVSTKSKNLSSGSRVCTWPDVVSSSSSLSTSNKSKSDLLVEPLILGLVFLLSYRRQEDTN